MEYTYIMQDMVTETQDYNLAGLWPLEEAAEVCMNTPNGVLCPDLSEKWLVLHIKDWDINN